MKYAALLRGINTGGRNTVSWEQLRDVVVAAGFKHVEVYIQTSTVTFTSSESSLTKVQRYLEQALHKAFPLPITVQLRSTEQLKTILTAAPAEWHDDADIRKYIAFLTPGLVAAEVVAQVVLRDTATTISAGDGVIYITTTLEGLSKGKLNKLLGKQFYSQIVVRNFVTTKKLVELLDVES